MLRPTEIDCCLWRPHGGVAGALRSLEQLRQLTLFMCRG